MKYLKKESFDINAESEKKHIGFYTDNPLLWYNALQEYTVVNDIINRCELKRNKNDKITICKIHACFNTVKQVLISVNFVTGVITLKGTSVTEWIETQFTKVKEFVSIVTERAEITEQIEEKIPPPCHESIYENSQSTHVENNETETEIQSLWSITETLQSSIKNIEVSIEDQSKRVSENETSHEDRYVQIERKIKDIEKKFDDKLSLYQEETDKMIIEKLDNIQKKVDNKITSMKEVIGSFKVEIQRQINDIANPDYSSLDTLRDQINKVETDLKETTSSCITESLDEVKEKYESMYVEINSQLTKITSEITQQEILIKYIQSKIQLMNKNHSQTNANVIPLNQRIYVNPAGSERENISDNRVTEDNKTELIMCFDSNSKYIDFRRLWTLNGTKVKSCGNWREVNKIVDEKTKYTNLKYFFTNVGCNDLDYHKGDEVFNNMKHTIEKLKTKYPGIKIIISEITPRMDELDIEVKVTNTLLNQYVKRTEDTYITWNSNLRDPDFFYDTKHIKDTCIARFAANIKRGLNKAYDRSYKPGSRIISHEGDNFRSSNFNNESSTKNIQRNEGNENERCNNMRKEMENTLKAELLRKITLALS